MKYCYNCKAYRPNTFRFCSQCGGSFSTRYCRKLHTNPVQAEYCGVCGSSDLSIPHKAPKFSNVGWTVAVPIVTALGALGFVVGLLAVSDSVPPGNIFLLMSVGGFLVFVWSRFKGHKRKKLEH